MLLVGVKNDGTWISSRWNLTYSVGWMHITKAVASVYDFYNNPEVLVNGNLLTVSNKQDILNSNEASNMVIRGISKILKVPVMITFYNQVSAVDVTVAAMGEEFENTDYEKFNKSLCQYLTSIELSMYR